MDDITVTGAWTALYSSFWDELAAQFPGDEAVRAAAESVRASATDPTRAGKALDEFLAAAGPRQAHVAARSDKATEGLVLCGVDIGGLWSSPEMARQSKDATFQFFSSLLLIGQTLRAIPSEMLPVIENAAKAIASNMSTGGAPPDLGSMVSMFSSGLSGLGALGLGAAAGGDGAAAAEGETTPTTERGRTRAPPGAPRVRRRSRAPPPRSKH